MIFTQELVRIAVEQDRKLQMFCHLVKRLELQVKAADEEAFSLLATQETLAELYDLADSVTD